MGTEDADGVAVNRALVFRVVKAVGTEGKMYPRIIVTAHVPTAVAAFGTGHATTATMRRGPLRHWCGDLLRENCTMRTHPVKITFRGAGECCFRWQEEDTRTA